MSNAERFSLNRGLVSRRACGHSFAAYGDESDLAGKDESATIVLAIRCLDSRRHAVVLHLGERAESRTDSLVQMPVRGHCDFCNRERESDHPND